MPSLCWKKTVGSPFGFTVADWEAVSLDHQDASRLIVGFGHQWDSKDFDSARLRTAIEAQFQRALTAALPRIKRDVALDSECSRRNSAATCSTRLRRHHSVRHRCV